MRVLLVNDDGYEALGLRKIYDHLKEEHEVLVVAPKMHQSAKSQSLTIYDELYLEEIEKDFYSLSGTPVDCVKFAVMHLKWDGDLIISGVNDGYNLGRNINYSGTVGACLEGRYLGFKTVALSVGKDCFSMIDENIEVVKDLIFKSDLVSKDYVLNINIPNLKTSEVKETFIFDRLSENYQEYYKVNQNGSFKIHVLINDEDQVDGSDVKVTKSGIISYSKIIPLKSL